MTHLNLKLPDLPEKLKSYFMEETPTKNVQEEAATATATEVPGTEIIPEQSVTPTAGRVFAAILNGLGVGLLLGLLLGLAVSPVVSGVIGTLSSILVILLGLNDKHLSTLKSLRIGSFGIFAVAGILFGIYIRTNDALSPTTTDLKTEYREAGFSKDQALYYTALEKFDYVPVGWFGTSERDTLAMATTDKSGKSVLFSSHVDLDQCATLNTADRTFPREEILYTFEAAGGVWQELATSMPEDMPDQAYVDGLLGIRDSFCELGGSGKVEVKGSETLNSLDASASATEIRQALKDSGGNWTAILENTEQKIPPKYQPAFYLTVIKIFSHEKVN